jgi:phage tail P2-like protein
MTDDIAVRQQFIIGPDATQPSLTLSETLIPAGLDISPPSLGTPEHKRGEISPHNLFSGAPWVGAPEFNQVVVVRSLQRPNRLLGSQLLYSASTGFEKAMADVESERLTNINAELIRDIWDPWACPSNLLPYLAWANGVQYWNDNWSITTKRAWVASQLIFKSLRGTRKGLEVAIDYAGRDVTPYGYAVTGVTTAPQKIFSGPSLTREQREDWLQKLPQVRVWRTYDQGFVSNYKSFYGSSAPNRLRSRRFFLDGPGHGSKLTAAVPSDAITRLKRVARWIENDIETDVRVTDFGSYFQLHKSGIEDGSVFSDKPFGLGRHYIPSTAHNRLLTIQPTPSLPWRSQMTPSLTAITSEPERVTVSGLRKHSVFSDLPMRDFFVPTTAPRRIFQRYAVLDPSVKQLRRTPVQFMGVGRFGFPPFTAWAAVTASGKLSPKAAGFDFWVPKAKFYIPHNGEALRQIRIAAQGAKTLRDKIMLQFGPKPRFLAGERPVLAGIDNVPAGSI